MRLKDLFKKEKISKLTVGYTYDDKPVTAADLKAAGAMTALLKDAGTSMEKVVKTTCFLSDMADFAAFNEVYGKYFTSKPARSCVAVKTLPKNVLCEVEVIALMK